LKASLLPLLKYAESGRWHFPFAPHDLGTYPLANGQVYGGRETSQTDQMPVEESGNMLLMIAAISKIEGNANLAAAYWPLLEKWAAYLKQEGLDPANQLSTDDFAGHLAHNANLSVKAIEALGAFATLCDLRGMKDQAKLYRETASDFAAKWITLARDDDHYRLAFDKPGTWSQKYNLVWDNILGLHLFPAQVADTETAFYLTKENRFGFPLDNRKAYTKLDWEFWSATLSPTQDRFERLIAPVYDWANQSPGRVPLTDWYWTDSGKQAGFQARSVVGGLYIKMLADPATWAKWAHRPPASFPK
ncbi:MAG: glutaminase domain-containing protein, partial [Terriglobia bacterium]